MSNELMNVQAFENAKPDAAFASLDPNSSSLADGVGSSYGIVHNKGKNWTLQYRGETFRFVRADDGTPLPYLDVVILRDPGIMSKTYYPEYKEGARDRPICSSINGVRPDDGVKEKQAEACALCPKNVWYVKPDGRRTRDCADNKRLALLILPNLTKAIMGDALMEPVFLRIPPGSLTNLALMGETMQRKGFHYSTFVTRIGFDPDHVLKMTFVALQPLTPAEAPVVLPMREDTLAYRITGEDIVGTAPLGPRITSEPPPVAITKKAAPPPQVIDVVPNEPVATGFVAAPVAAKPAAPIEVEESNPDLDNLVANLLKTS